MGSGVSGLYGVSYTSEPIALCVRCLLSNLRFWVEEYRRAWPPTASNAFMF